MDLRAAPLQNRTLPEALAALAQRSCDELALPIQFSCLPERAFPQLSTRLEAGIYPIAQEALANACKHARAQHIEMTLSGNDEYVELVVQDDGRGFDPDMVAQIGEGQHFGLTGMMNARSRSGGIISIQSALGAGTRIAARVPHREKEQ